MHLFDFHNNSFSRRVFSHHKTRDEGEIYIGKKFKSRFLGSYFEDSINQIIFIFYFLADLEAPRNSFELQVDNLHTYHNDKDKPVI